MTSRRAAATLAAGLLVLAACGGGDGDSTSASGVTTAPSSADATTSAPTDATTVAPAVESVATTAPATPPATSAPAATTDPGAAPTSAAPVEGLWEDPTGTFRIAFPADPTKQNIQAPLPDGTTLPVTAYLAEVAGAAVIASCVVYPDPASIDPATVLDSARDGALANIGADLVDSDPIELQGRDGVAYRGDIGEAGAVLARTFLDGAQLCQVLVVGEPAVIEESATPILDTFEFVKETA